MSSPIHIPESDKTSNLDKSPKGTVSEQQSNQWYIPVSRKSLMSVLSRGYLDAKSDFREFGFIEAQNCIPLFRDGMSRSEMNQFYSSPEKTMLLLVDPVSLGNNLFRTCTGKTPSKPRKLSKSIPKSAFLLLTEGNICIDVISALVFENDQGMTDTISRPFGNFDYDIVEQIISENAYKPNKTVLSNRKKYIGNQTAANTDLNHESNSNFLSDRVAGFYAALATDRIKSQMALNELEIFFNCEDSSNQVSESGLIYSCISIVNQSSDNIRIEKSALDLYERYGIDGVMLFGAMAFFSDVLPRDGWAAGELLDSLKREVKSVGPKEADVEAFETWYSFCRDILNNKKSIPRLEDSGGSLIQRSLLLIQVRSSLDHVLDTKDGNLLIGSNVRALSAGLAGFVTGFEGLETEFKIRSNSFGPWSAVSYQLREYELERAKLRWVGKCRRVSEFSESSLAECLEVSTIESEWTRIYKFAEDYPQDIVDMQHKLTSAGYEIKISKSTKGAYEIALEDSGQQDEQLVKLIFTEFPASNHGFKAKALLDCKSYTLKKRNAVNVVITELSGVISAWHVKAGSIQHINVVLETIQLSYTEAQIVHMLSVFVVALKRINQIIR